MEGKVYILDYRDRDILEFDFVRDEIIRRLDIDGINNFLVLFNGGLVGIIEFNVLLVISEYLGEFLEINLIIGLVINFFYIFNNSNGVVVVDNEIYIGNNNLVNIDVFDCFGVFLWIINNYLNYLVLVLGGDDVVLIIFKELNDILI